MCLSTSKTFFFSPHELKHRGRAGKTSMLGNGDTICPVALFEAQMCNKSDCPCIDCRVMRVRNGLGFLLCHAAATNQLRGHQSI